MIQSDRVSKHVCGRGQMVSSQEQETLQQRALNLQTPINSTFDLSTWTLWVCPCLVHTN